MFIHFKNESENIIVNADQIVCISEFTYMGEYRVSIELIKGKVILSFENENKRKDAINAICNFIDSECKYIYIDVKELTKIS